MNKFLEFICKNILTRTKSSLILSLVFLSLFMPGLGKLTSNFGIRGWLVSDDPLVVQLDKFETEFGNDETILVALESNSTVLDVNSIEFIKSRETELMKMKSVSSVSSIASHEILQEKAGMLRFVKLISETTSIDALKEKIEDDPTSKSYLISDDYKTAFVHANLVKSNDKPIDYSVIIKKLKSSVNDLKKPNGIKLHYSGSVTLNAAFKEIAEQDMQYILRCYFYLFQFFIRSI